MVSFDFLDRRGAERFAELLDETGDDRRPEGARRHGRDGTDEQLAELVAIGHSLAGARTGVRVEAEFRTGLRAMLVATAERDGMGRTAEPDPEPENEVAVKASVRSLLGRGSARRIRARGAIVIGVAAGAMAVSGISAASENATPGSALYGVKRSTERAQLAMAGSDLTRGQLSLDFARNRLAEAGRLPGDDPDFPTVLDDMDNDTRQGVRLLTSSAVARKDKAPLNTVDAFVNAQKIRMAPVLTGLSPVNQERAAESMSLLSKAGDRSDLLRGGLACAIAATTGTDSLGPVLDDCITGSGSTGNAPDQQGASEKQKSQPAPRSTKTKPEPSASTSADAVTPKKPKTPSQQEPLAPSATADPGPSAGVAPADQGATTGDDTGSDPLGGLLGGIFGN